DGRGSRAPRRHRFGSYYLAHTARALAREAGQPSAGRHYRSDISDVSTISDIFDFCLACPFNSYYDHNMSQRQQHKNETRGRIVASAIRHMKTQGLSVASVSDIMGRAGLTVGGFYAHFPSKDALADEAVRCAVGERRRMFLDRFDGLEWNDRVGSALRE